MASYRYAVNRISLNVDREFFEEGIIKKIEAIKLYDSLNLDFEIDISKELFIYDNDSGSTWSKTLKEKLTWE